MYFIKWRGKQIQEALPMLHHHILVDNIVNHRNRNRMRSNARGQTIPWGWGWNCVYFEVKDDMSQFYCLVTQLLNVILYEDMSPLIFSSAWRLRLILWHIFHWTVLCQLLFSVEYFSTPFTVKLSCEGKVDITIEILVNSKAALELAIRVSHIFTSDVVNPWEETTMVLSVDLVLLIFFWASLETIHIDT